MSSSSVMGKKKKLHDTAKKICPPLESFVIPIDHHGQVLF